MSVRDTCRGGPKRSLENRWSHSLFKTPMTDPWDDRMFTYIHLVDVL